MPAHAASKRPMGQHPVQQRKGSREGSTDTIWRCLEEEKQKEEGCGVRELGMVFAAFDAFEQKGGTHFDRAIDGTAKPWSVLRSLLRQHSTRGQSCHAAFGGTGRLYEEGGSWKHEVARKVGHDRIIRAPASV